MRFFFLFILCLPLAVSSQLQLAKIFSDNMVMQRDQPIHIWGKAIPGQTVSLSFANEKASIRAKIDSTWIATFKRQQANATPQTLSIKSGNEKTEIKNILIGDIWLCIGQSNMEWPMQKEMHYTEALPNSRQPLMRLYNPTYAGKNTYNVLFTDSIIQNLTKENFYKGQWQNCDSNSFKTMSAVAWYFGKELATRINIPVGLINISIGGAPLETFISTEALKNSKQFADKLNGDWLKNDALPVWIRERGKQNVGGLTIVPQDEYGNNHAFKPGLAFEAGIAPIMNLPIKGILCYQGESNAQEIERVIEYAALSKLIIEDYRKKWKQPDLPFFYVQLSSIDTMNYKGHLWPQFRNEQRKMLNLIPNIGMAVCSDIGFKNDVHPTNKKNVGERLARWALNKTYYKDSIPSGPLPLKAKFNDGEMIIAFQYFSNGLKTSDGKSIRGFSVDGKNEIPAFIKNNQIVIKTEKKPEWIYYGWKPFSDANLSNSENLPASTFKIKVQ
ncbi:MAG TPA: sialate O-acetylesterase [Chitinophagaceae bacterium]|nr:sialate O-acetylesterase [Chitinophagaceae bacterium]